MNTLKNVIKVILILLVLLTKLPVFIPLIVIARGFITDGIRSLAFERGYTAFGKTTMMESKIGKFIVASNFSRGSYAVAKAFAFVLMIIAYVPNNIIPAQNIILIVQVMCQTTISLEFF